MTFKLIFGRWAGAALMASLIAGSSASVEAQSARELFQLGTSEYGIGNYEDAIDAWQRAYDLDPQPLILFNIGQAYERLGRLVEAVETIERFLMTASPDDRYREDGTIMLEGMRRRLERTGIVIHSNVDGAAILIDGEDVARTPRRDRLQVTPGAHHVVVRYEGYRDYELNVTVPDGREIAIDAHLDPADASLEFGDDEEPVDAGPTTHRPLGAWILTGGGGAMLVTGIALGAVAWSDAQDTPLSTSPEADSAKSKAIAADVLIWTGAAAAAAGILWLFLGAETVEDEAVAGSWRLTPVLGPTTLGADAQVRF